MTFMSHICVQIIGIIFSLFVLIPEWCVQSFRSHWYQTCEGAARRCFTAGSLAVDVYWYEFYLHFFNDGWLTCCVSCNNTTRCQEGKLLTVTQYITACSNRCSLMKERENMEQLLDWRFYSSWGLLGKSSCFRGFSGYCSRNETPLQEWSRQSWKWSIYGPMPRSTFLRRLNWWFMIVQSWDWLHSRSASSHYLALHRRHVAAAVYCY